MYTVAVKRDFVAQHFLIGGDWGAENERHSHHYAVEVRLEGAALDEHGYLVDIVAVEGALGEMQARYRDRTLNELPEFAGLNPSLEHFARILGQALLARLCRPNLSALAVRIWENDVAWAGYRQDLSGCGREVSG